jgi:uncharacterized protein (TIGR03435 family)
MNRTIVLAVCILYSALATSAQTTTELPEFEVASVKRVAEPEDGPRMPVPLALQQAMGFSGGPGTKDPGRIDYSKKTLKLLLARAYNLKPEQISGPGWLETERYTIAAKLPPGTDAESLRLMLQKLLTERFQISLHREAKELPIYRLKVAKNGPKLMPAVEPPQYADEAERAEAMRKGAQEQMAKLRESLARDGLRAPGSRGFTLPRATLERFAEWLSGNVDRPVKDMTQIEGVYFFHLSWSPNARLDDDSTGTSIFDAIQQQLGLKLEAAKEQFEILVIDKAEKIPLSN